MSEPRDLNVAYVGGDRFTVSIGPHVVTIDQPGDEGGEDLGPTPTELFVASLVSCMGFFAQRFLRRNGYDTCGMTLSARMTWARHPNRVGTVDVDVTGPEIPDGLLAALRRTIEHCTVHNSLSHPPDVTVNYRRG